MIAGIFYIPYTLKHVQKTFSFKSNNATKPFNRNEEPSLMLQYTDIHVDHVNEKNNEQFTNAVNFGLNLKPAMYLFTGDLTNNFPYNNYPKYGSQQPKDWEIYRNITQNIQREQLFEITGNHDEFGVFEFTSQSHNFIKSIKENISNYEDFQIQKRVITSNGGYNISIIGLNPFIYPSAHPPFVYWPRPTKELLNNLEKVLKEIPENDEVIVMNHYPLKLFMSTVKSSSGKTFKEILTKGKVNYFLTGHLHPTEPKIMHHSDMLEIIGMDLKDHQHIGCISYDNRRFIYHKVNISNLPKAFITNPVPDSMLTHHQIFNEVGTPIRIISFHSVMPTIKLSGNISGVMDCKVISGQKYLCESQEIVEPGTYHVKFEGDFEDSIDFTIGNSSQSYYENDYRHVLDFHENYPFQFALLMIVFLFILFPLPQSQFSHTIISHLQGQESAVTIHTYIILLLFGGMLYIRFRIQRLPLYVKIILLIGFIYPILLPMAFMEIETHFGFIWTWGYFCGGKFVYCPWGLFNCMAYYVSVLAPVVLIAASLSLSYPFSFYSFIPVLFDIAVSAFLLFVDIKYVIRFIYETVGFVFAPTSPVFVFLPILLYGILIIWRLICAFKRESTGISTTKESLFLST